MYDDICHRRRRWEVEVKGESHGVHNSYHRYTISGLESWSSPSSIFVFHLPCPKLNADSSKPERAREFPQSPTSPFHLFSHWPRSQSVHILNTSFDNPIQNLSQPCMFDNLNFFLEQRYLTSSFRRLRLVLSLCGLRQFPK